MKGKIFCGREEIPFNELSRLTIQADKKLWRYDHHTQEQMTFTLVDTLDDSRNNAIGAWVRQWRRIKNFTQEQAAGLFGVSQPLIAGIESGKKMIQRAMFIRIHKDHCEYRRRHELSSASEDYLKEVMNTGDLKDSVNSLKNRLIRTSTDKKKAKPVLE